MPGTRAEKISEALRLQLERNPQESFDLILRVSAATDPQQRAIEQAGLQVRHRLTLVPSFAVTGPGQAVLSLLHEPWLQSIEPDQPVRTF
jgi:hypothetical protein